MNERGEPRFDLLWLDRNEPWKPKYASRSYVVCNSFGHGELPVDNEPVRSVYFPTSGIASIVAIDEGGESVLSWLFEMSG